MLDPFADARYYVSRDDEEAARLCRQQARRMRAARRAARREWLVGLAWTFVALAWLWLCLSIAY